MKTLRAELEQTERQRSVKRGSLMRVIVPLAVALPFVAHGIGVRLPNQDPEAVARGNAFVATADNPAAIYYNPAGITQLEGQNLSFGVQNYLGINTHFVATNGASANTKFEVVPTPEIYYTLAPKDCPLSFGLGVYAPFGLAVSWPETTPFRSLAIEGRLTYLAINPVVAWKVHRTLSIAVGPTFNYSNLEVSRGLAMNIFGPPDVFKFHGDDFSLGLNAGLLWQPNEQWSVGANYRSAATSDFEGTSSYNSVPINSSTHTKASVPFPEIVSAGVSYRPTSKWNFEFDVDYTDWNTLNTVTFEGTHNLGFPTDLALQLDWRGSWLYEFGVTRYLDNGWFVSAGYFYSGETTPTKTFTPAVPDTELHVGSLGFGHKGERWRWAVAAQIIAGPARNVSGSQPNPFSGESADGSYQLFVPTVSVSVGYRF